MVTGIGSVPGSQGTQGSVINSVAIPSVHPAEPTKRPSDNRRSNKPIMEKRRRARINNCLNELKTLILDATKKDPARHSKLEKADILEKTVKHLQELQRQQMILSQATDPSVLNKFKAGFTECANEVRRFPDIEVGVKRRLLQHLSFCINGAKTDPESSAIASPNTTVQVHILPSPPSSPEQDAPQHHVTMTSNGYFLVNGSGNGIQLIPTKLANGNIAFMLPQTMPSNPVPMLIPIPTRTASTSSAASNTSSNGVSRDSMTSPTYYAPLSPTNSYDAQDLKPPSPTPMTSRSPDPNNPVPLALVMRKSYDSPPEDDKLWRPW
ncbi:protein hairy isoform X1 [Phlebotomus papatasi]|uniref:protein hairy isoform X1 n=2 Tax=Phlebotomus papatasi TaxID=29031 RepID=UPI002483D473|nr:protein hairy isoform X1 [Phlebotomus papatasi]